MINEWKDDECCVTLIDYILLLSDNIELKMMNAIVMNWWNLIDNDEWHAMSVLIVILDDIVWMMINH